MKFIDDLYEFYKDKLVGDEEDAVALILYTLQEHTREDLMKLIGEMSDEEVFQMVGQFLIGQLKEKMAREGLGQHRPVDENQKIH
ncbi:hypothetical protein CathTA2_1796 [Caldalkalibacillus thermarum TA2.A1]|uniref:DUF6154 family protein n=1 Tax=Caldalkalibacillus thermarum (strain TA2.A1) TaxID=986075 RepID=F5L7J6_CALTT|nr:DUF6154 family protein [Caldalkalibacillus thermarum]EGL82710.1 hypothetical protein CathTA2_1796 [Caldalkalibacillus thermarum TA2.A1]QZT33749.1 DUF6154 family protein [Caldalkalibacillus thermarum TA2.A1]